MRSLSQILDKLTDARISQVQTPVPDSEAGLSPEDILALKFKPGQKIINPTTGKEVTVLGGTRIYTQIPYTERK